MTPAKKTTDKKPVAAKKPAAPRKKKEAVVEAAETAPAETAANVPKEGYIYALGRRKTAIAQTRLFPGGTGEIKVNGKDYQKYFTVYEQRAELLSPLKAVGQDDKVNINLKVYGGGMRGQAGAARLGIARALMLMNPAFRLSLKQLGFVTRDPREKERKKYGLKKARKGPQWAKR